MQVPIGSLQRAHLNGSLRFYIPTDCPDWTSVAIAFYGSDNSRTYAMAVLKHPGTPVGQGEIQIEGSKRTAWTFKPGPAFNAQTGDYWNGAMWLPTAYMGIRALTENGQSELADQTAEAVLRQMYLTYRDYDPHTIWEFYNPGKPETAYQGGNRVTPNFCGWSALGPLSLFIENVMGIHSINAQDGVVTWRLHQTGRNGVRNLHFGKITADIVFDGQKHIDVVSNGAFTQVVNGQSFKVKQGKKKLLVK